MPLRVQRLALPNDGLSFDSLERESVLWCIPEPDGPTDENGGSECLVGTDVGQIVSLAADNSVKGAWEWIMTPGEGEGESSDVVVMKAQVRTMLRITGSPNEVMFYQEGSRRLLFASLPESPGEAVPVFEVCTCPDMIGASVTSADGAIVIIGCANGTLQAYLTADGALIAEQEGAHTGDVDLLATSFDYSSRLLASASSTDGLLTVWHVSASHGFTAIYRTLCEDSENICAIAVSAANVCRGYVESDSVVSLATTTGVIRRFCFPKQSFGAEWYALPEILLNDSSQISSMSISPDGTILGIGCNNGNVHVGSVRLYDMESSVLLRVIPMEANISSASFCPYDYTCFIACSSRGPPVVEYVHDGVVSINSILCPRKRLPLPTVPTMFQLRKFQEGTAAREVMEDMIKDEAEGLLSGGRNENLNQAEGAKDSDTTKGEEEDVCIVREGEIQELESESIEAECRPSSIVPQPSPKSEVIVKEMQNILVEQEEGAKVSEAHCQMDAPQPSGLEDDLRDLFFALKRNLKQEKDEGQGQDDEPNFRAEPVAARTYDIEDDTRVEDEPGPVDRVCSLASPDVYSTLLLAKKIEKLTTEYVAEGERQQRHILKLQNLETQMQSEIAATSTSHTLTKIDSEISQKFQRKLPKQVDPKWLATQNECPRLTEIWTSDLHNPQICTVEAVRFEPSSAFYEESCRRPPQYDF